MRNKYSISTPARQSHWLVRLVRWFGPTWCWVGMMTFILTANSRAAGVDAMLVAFFAMSYGLLSTNGEMNHE